MHMVVLVAAFGVDNGVVNGVASVLVCIPWYGGVGVDGVGVAGLLLQRLLLLLLLLLVLRASDDIPVSVRVSAVVLVIV